ncbi:receptor-like protein kinase FERONIA-like protein [Corchorus olitorius]|uniref:Receptor-like protein kinase FERONIA-like protein n=1 Tax=Corchorus olitorius TaxID=93759 RepID=A0A1R3G8V2_9ROSI|nr:receptor-like protein kinase FERONIA-like protein [Corchorus olitorius]
MESKGRESPRVCRFFLVSVISRDGKSLWREIREDQGEDLRAEGSVVCLRKMREVMELCIGDDEGERVLGRVFFLLGEDERVLAEEREVSVRCRVNSGEESVIESERCGKREDDYSASRVECSVYGG